MFSAKNTSRPYFNLFPLLHTFSSLSFEEVVANSGAENPESSSSVGILSLILTIDETSLTTVARIIKEDINYLLMRNENKFFQKDLRTINF